MNNFDPTSFADWLRTQRKLQKFTQSDLASILRVSQNTISLWERAKLSPDAVQLELLEKLFGNLPLVVDADKESSSSSASVGWGEDYPLDAVFVRIEPRPIVDVHRRIRDGRYDLNPDFQRAFVWSIEKQSRLIESCIMRIPLPVIYVAEAPDGKIIVVDGLQRLTTFRRYLENEFALNFQLNEDGTKHPLQGKYFKDLDVKLRERIEDTVLTLYILDSKAPERAKLDIFDRVNSGVPLSRQQMRNSLHNGQATRWLRDMAQNEIFLRVTGESLNSIEMKDREAINRFCAFYLIGWKNYRAGEMDALLGEVLEKMNQLNSSELDMLRLRFEQSLLLNEQCFNEHAFRKSLLGDEFTSRSLINLALFEVCTVWFARLHPNPSPSDLKTAREAIRFLVQDEKFNRAITQATTSKTAVQTRFELAGKLLKGITT